LPRAPIGPNVQESSGRLSQMATFQDLLASPHDEDLFQHFATSQLARIDTQTGQIERIGPAALITRVDPSPDEKYLLVSAVRRPFSYRVPYVYFTRKTEVWDADGRPVARPPTCRSPTTSPARAFQPALEACSGSLSTTPDCSGPRRSTAATLGRRFPIATRSWRCNAPFTGKPNEVMKVQHRFSGFAWLPEKDRSLVSEFDRDRRWRTSSLVDLTKPVESRKVLFDLSINDAYKDPGVPLTVSRPDGTRTILQDGDSIYLTGQGASPEGSRPFLDKLDLKTGVKSRLFHCGERTFESALGFVGDSRSTILIGTRPRPSRPIISQSISSRAGGPSSPISATQPPSSRA